MTEIKKANIINMTSLLLGLVPNEREHVSGDTLNKLASFSDSILTVHEVETFLQPNEIVVYVKSALADAAFQLSTTKSASSETNQIMKNIETLDLLLSKVAAGDDYAPKWYKQPMLWTKQKLYGNPVSAGSEAPKFNYTEPISHENTTLRSAANSALGGTFGKVMMGAGTAASFGIGMLDPDKTLGENAASTAAWTGGDFAGSMLGAYGAGKFEDWRRNRMTPEQLHREQVHSDFVRNQAQQAEIHKAQKNMMKNPNSNKFNYTYGGQHYSGAEGQQLLQQHLATHQAEVNKFNELHGHEKPTFLQRSGRYMKGFGIKTLPGMLLSFGGGTLASGLVDSYNEKRKLHENIGNHINNISNQFSGQTQPQNDYTPE